MKTTVEKLSKFLPSTVPEWHPTCDQVSTHLIGVKVSILAVYSSF